MRTYELTTIFRMSDEEFSKGKEFVSAELEKAGATIKSQEDKGIREFAYSIKKEKRGRYLYLETELDPTKVIDLERAFLLSDSVLKFLFVKKES
ncbi:30S ribosomal protein S6 [Sediminispirochaeta bajacaliforniensis]|uniref:30S ribosomal protein S6 n=1 Tax=Sediminispirochaeta bajacaliforniensis TaxID=148 RepID=UPI0003666E33|nr:30S ribosomal protein S6 [Sediminispirochaeta bajacaliforniensis]